jgi:ribonuclease P protein component
MTAPNDFEAGDQASTRGVPVDVTVSCLPPERLKRRAEFLRVASKGKKTPSSGVVLQALTRDDQGPARLGFTVTKKVGNAVIRNRTRRRLREAARAVLKTTDIRGVDLVLIGRDSTRDRRFTLLIEDFRRALVKLGVVA